MSASKIPPQMAEAGLQTRPRWRDGIGSRFDVLAMFAMLLATFVTFWPVTHFQFINYDDPVYVTDNPFVKQGLSADGVRWAFQNIEAEFWQPIVWLSHMCDWQFHGPASGGHHLTSLLIHLLNTLLLFLLLKHMTGAAGRSAVVAGLFALHPLHVESVAWIAERKDVVSTFFGLLSLYSYAKYFEARQRGASSHPNDSRSRKSRNSRVDESSERTQRRGTVHYALSLLWFLLSLMSKPLFVTLPFLLLLLDYWPLNRYGFDARTSKVKNLLKFCREKIPFFAMSLASCVATFWIQSSRHNVGGSEQYPLALRLSNATMSYLVYLRKMVWPSDLAMFYPYPDAWPVGQVIGAMVLLLGISVLALWLWRRRPYAAVGWFWFLGTLVPMIGLVQVSHHSMADRYTYFPLIGVFIVLTWGAADAFAGLRAGRPVPLVAATAALALCAVLSRAQVLYWENSTTLNTHALAVTADNYIAHANLGAALADEKKFDEALSHFQRAFGIESSLRFNPDLPSIRFGLGTVLALKGQLEGAKTHFLRLLEVQPDVPKLHHNLATLLMLQGNVNDAIAHYEQAIRLNPDYDEARANLAIAIQQRERWTAASAHVESANRLAKDQRPREAIEQFHLALGLRPDWPEVLNNLAWLLATEPTAEARNGPEAVALAERACQLTGRTNFWMLSTLAAAYAEAGNFPAAIATQQQVCDLARELGQTDHMNSFLKRLELYRSGHAYRRTQS